MSKLTARQSRFCEEFIRDCNGTQAAARAGYSSKTARQIAAENLSKPAVFQRIKELRAELTANCEVTAAAVLQQAAKIATADVRDLYDEHGELLPPHLWPDRAAAAVSSVEFGPPGSTTDPGAARATIKRVRFADRTPALVLLARHMGMFERDNRQQHALPFDQLSPEVRELIGRKLREVIDRGRLTQTIESTPGDEKTH